MKNAMSIIILITSLFLTGCDKDIEFVTTLDNNDTEIENKAPIANAGEDRVTTVFTSIEIVGSGTDSDGQIVDYEWRREDGTVISGLKTFTYMPSAEGNYTFTLIVLDDDDKTGSDTMRVTVNSR
jgi:hypothetical protein